MNWIWMVLITFSILYVSVMFTSIYLHRFKTHGGLDLHPVVAFAMHLELSLFTGIVPREWVAVHRKHHHFSDEEEDPHSPYQKGWKRVLFMNFLMYRNVIKQDSTLLSKYTPDWKPDLIDKLSIEGRAIFGSLVIFCLMFGGIWGAAAWLLHAALYIFLNSMINSLGHKFGYKNYQNTATNLRWLALITSGEGLHNNHHEFPTSALFAHRRREIDPAWGVISLLKWTGMAHVKPLPMERVTSS